MKISNLNKEKEQEKNENNLNVNKIYDEKKINDNYTKTSSIDSSLTNSTRSTRIRSIYDEFNKNETLKDENQIKAKTFIIPKEINPNFLEEFETEKITIIHKKSNNKVISKMTFNLFLKKIVINNFYNENILYVTNFAEQCYYFLKKEIVIKKIINCYNYYIEIKVPFNQRKNLIYFLNLLVIKMYNHYIKINTKDEVLILLNNFYNLVINELKQSINKSKKTSEKIKNFIDEGINKIKESVNTINKNIKDNAEKMNIFKDNFSKNSDKIKSEEKDDLKEKNKSKNNNNKEKENIIDEKLLNECEKIKALFKTEQPNHEILVKLEKSLFIYVLKVKFKIKMNRKRNEENALTKSNSQSVFSIFTLESKKIKNKIEKKNYFDCRDWDTRDIGEELIYITQTALNKINRKELYNGVFTKKTKNITCPGIMENINLFNKLIFFIIEDILSYDFPEIRAKIIEKWAYVADYCRKRKDYNNIFAIDSVFNSYIISTLKLTWKEIGNKTKKLIKEIDVFCSFEGNYKNIRDDMKLLSKNDFYTPYLGLLLKDLNFYEENYKYLDKGNLINFDKINGIQTAIDEFFHFQKIVDTKVTVLPKELNFFENLECKNESYLENLAQKLEPKFVLYINPKNEKRKTEIDIKYFKDHCSKHKKDILGDNNKI